MMRWHTLLSPGPSWLPIGCTLVALAIAVLVAIGLRQTDLQIALIVLEALVGTLVALYWRSEAIRRRLSASQQATDAEVRKLRDARDAAEAAERLLRDAIDSMSEGFAIYGEDDRLVLCNKRYRDMFPKTAGEAPIGTRYEDLLRAGLAIGVYPQAMGREQEWLEHRLRVHAQPEADYVYRLKNGRWVLTTERRMPNGGMAGLRIDVTRLKQTEADAEQARQLLARQKADLAAVIGRLRAADAAKSLFLANMSHELRTPLNAIIGFSEMMCEARLGPIGSHYRDYACHIHASGQNLLRIVDDVLDASKLDEGELKLRDEPTDLAELARDCAQALHELARDRAVEITVKAPDYLPRVTADRQLIRRALLSVVSNAIKFNRDGGRVTVALGEPEVDRIAIAISDSGIGMRPEDVPAALKAFHQLDGTLSRRYGGIGLGLPLAKAFLELHGGGLDIDTEAGHGTTVTLWLPRSRLLLRYLSTGSDASC